jgi:amino acid transporter
LIALGSYTAIAAIFSITAIAYDWSYCIPIICKMVYGKFEPGPFHLGRYSYAINLWSVVWTAFASVIFIFPNYKPVTDVNVSVHSVLLISRANADR